LFNTAGFSTLLKVPATCMNEECGANVDARACGRACSFLSKARIVDDFSF